MFFVDKWVHSISLINVQPEENCRIDEWLDLNGWNSDLIGQNSDLLDGIPIWLDGIWIWLDGIPTWLNGMLSKCWCWKKSAWTDLDRVSFKKFVKESNVEIKKSAWTGLDKVKKASSAASVFKISSRLVTRGSPTRFALRWPDLDKRCSRCYTLRGCVFADVQSREELKMLLQAKRQPGYKMPGRVVWPSLSIHERMTKNWLWKIIRNNLMLQLAVPLQHSVTAVHQENSPQLSNAKILKVKCKSKDFKRTNTNVTILNPNKSMHGKTLVKMVHKINRDTKMICCKLTYVNQKSSIRKS